MHRSPRVSDIAETLAALSGRQQQVVTLVCEGFSNKAIAAKLDISEGTVKGHLHAIYDKLGVQSRFALAIACADRSKSNV